MVLKVNKRTRKAPEVATIWKLSGEPDAYGNQSYEAPIYAWVKYNDQQRLFIDLDGHEKRGRATVFCEQDIAKIGDVILNGVSEEITPVPGSFSVKDRRAISNFSGTRTEYRYTV